MFLSKKGFTLIEVLIVIVIIGILAITLMPKLLGMQVSAKDTARIADTRQIGTALQSYAYMNNGIPTLPGTGYKNMSMLSGTLSEYIKSIAMDKGNGLMVNDAGDCIVSGDYYAYYANSTDDIAAVTSIMEGGKGNTANCKGMVSTYRGFSKYSDGHNVVVGDYQAGDPVFDYPSSDQWTPASAFGFNPSTSSITSYTSSSKNVVIPEMINGVPVTSIGSYAFLNHQLLSITIPSSVNTIGSFAFHKNQLLSITIPSSVTSIDDGAFCSNQFTGLTIPSSVISIGSFAFCDNKLTSITLPNSITNIGLSMFSSNQFTSLTIPDSVIHIGIAAFANNQLTSLTIHNSVKSIFNDAFRANKLTSVTIPSSVTTLGLGAFSYNGPNNTSNDITDFVPGTEQTWILNGNTRVKQ